MFQKAVVVDNTGMNEWAKNRLKQLAVSVDFYDDFPDNSSLVQSRIGNADCLLVSYCTPITREIIEACPNLKYIGMCCSLYSEKSANVDIACARERNITVTGIFDYGDGGVIEFGVSSLIQLFHGFGGKRWKERPCELDGQKIGILGMGTTGFKLAKALQFFGAEIYYSDLNQKPFADEMGMKYLPLNELLSKVDILSTQLPKNSCLLKEKEFEIFGNGKILLNTSIGPTFSVPALKKWLSNPSNFYICEGVGIGDTYEELKNFSNFIYTPVCAGSSEQCTIRLSQKSIANVEKFLNIK